MRLDPLPLFLGAEVVLDHWRLQSALQQGLSHRDGLGVQAGFGRGGPAARGEDGHGGGRGREGDYWRAHVCFLPVGVKAFCGEGRGGSAARWDPPWESDSPGRVGMDSPGTTMTALRTLILSACG